MADTESDIPAAKTSLGHRTKKVVKTRRWWTIAPLPLAIIIANCFGPDGWHEPYVRLLWLSWIGVFVALAHFFRKALFDYADMKKAWDRALENATGAGLAFLGLCIVIAALLFSISTTARAQDVRTYIPSNAKVLLPQLRAVQEDYWPAFPMPSYFGALIEQESCISLTHSKCWNSRAQLKTAREEGAGIGQFTRAYRADGALRFDAIAEVRALDPAALSEFNWATVYTRADLSMRAIIVKFKDTYGRLERQTKARPADLVAFSDSAYNGGAGGLARDRQLCHLATGCDANVWFGNVEHYSAKSRAKWQGYGKSAFEINREHVSNVLILRRPKYRAALGADLI